MLVEDLIHRFQLAKKQPPLHVNELLDFIQKSYIYGEFSIVEYKKHFFELNKLGAEKPMSLFEKIRS
ncbi:YppF family protein [Bacillus cihuensis]|uniref:YppF family protein n=1 Tax=Bacillus cihuensis TaxID=1208599 RepID=UPI0004152F0A|nr:YppF family protein [Bacillus cihuensis]